ncbi:MAG: Tim44/TimA family putative adaptor protein [Rhizobiales bacterium]|nr:Tim44/TimA family putative adaptor protein [Hyphomicrobiales bacterium]
MRGNPARDGKMDGTSEFGINLWPAIAIAIGWVYLLVFHELHKRDSGDMPDRPVSAASKAPAELRSSTLRRPASLAEQSFDETRFLDHAGAAYEFILARYAAGDMEKLSHLLDADVLEAFSAETARRAEAGETLALEFVGLESSRILDKRFGETEAAIRVRFESELFLSEGREPADGDATVTTLLRAVDIWTFRREYSSKSPVWTLAATDSE